MRSASTPASAPAKPKHVSSPIPSGIIQFLLKDNPKDILKLMMFSIGVSSKGIEGLGNREWVLTTSMGVPTETIRGLSPVPIRHK